MTWPMSMAWNVVNMCTEYLTNTQTSTQSVRPVIGLRKGICVFASLTNVRSNPPHEGASLGVDLVVARTNWGLTGQVCTSQ